MPTLDCLTCGVCCMANVSKDAYKVILSPTDSTKEIPKEFLVEITMGARKYNAIKIKKNEQKISVCSCLDGTVGTAVSCSIYATKPKSCTDFAVGSPGCLFYRNRLKNL